MEEKKDNFRHILRVGGVDLVGDKKLVNELRKIKGVSFMFANMLCSVADVDKNQKVGYMEDDSVKKIEEVLNNPDKFKVPSWIYNRRSDPEEGTDKHLYGSDLTFTNETDVRLMKKIKDKKDDLSDI